MRRKTLQNWMNKVIFVLALGIIFLTAGNTHAQTAICKGSPLPAGNIIIGEGSNNRCPINISLNTWIIKIPASVDVMCKASPLPANFIIYGEGANTRCPINTGLNAWSIKVPASTDVMCKASPLPAGYAFNGETSSMRCPGGQRNAWNIKRR